MKNKTNKKSFKQRSLYLVYKDLLNYYKFIKIIKSEENDKASTYNKLGLNRNKLFNIYIYRYMEDGDEQLPKLAQRHKLIESLNSINSYLDLELGYGEYLVPEFNQFFDDDEKPTLTYLVMYRFMFQRLTFGWALKVLGGIGLLTFLLINYIHYPIEWIQKLVY